MKKITLIILTLAFALTLKAQDVTGDWYGALNINGAQLRIVFHINKSADVYATTFDSPDQGATGLGIDKTTVNNNAVTIESTDFSFKYTGVYKPDSAIIRGVFSQGPGSFPLLLTRNKPDNKQGSLKRPQDPTTFPYKQEDLSFTNPKAGNVLAGTLTIPSSGKVSKIVVLITGSGAQDRNEELQGMNHRPFLVWSDWLTRNGIAVLRYDDRGIAKSTGVFASSTSADFADDVEAAVNFILSRPDLKNLSIGLIGHSEGGIIAPMVASRNNAVKFICLLAGPGIPIVDLMMQQQKDQLRVGGMSEEAMKIPQAINRNVYKTIVNNPELNTAALKAKVDTVIVHELGAYPPATFATQSKQDMANNISTQLLTPWYRYFLTFNPANYLLKVKCPVLALNGTLDTQVESTANLAGIKAALQKGGNQQHEEIALTGLNHLFQKAKTGGVNEYAQIAETINPQALELVSNWIKNLGN